MSPISLDSSDRVYEPKPADNLAVRWLPKETEVVVGLPTTSEVEALLKTIGSALAQPSQDVETARAIAQLQNLRPNDLPDLAIELNRLHGQIVRWLFVRGWKAGPTSEESIRTGLAQARAFLALTPDEIKEASNQVANGEQFKAIDAILSQKQFQEDFREILVGFVNIKSPSRHVQGVRDMDDRLASLFPWSDQIKSSLVPTKSHGDGLMVKVNENDPGLDIVGIGHLETVPDPENVGAPHFDPEDSDWLFGQGTADMKAGDLQLAMLICAADKSIGIEALGSLIFFYNTDEEDVSPESRFAMAHHLGDADMAHVFEASRINNGWVGERKGYAEFKPKFTGPNAGRAMAKLIEEAQAMNTECNGYPKDLTVNVGVLNASPSADPSSSGGMSRKVLNLSFKGKDAHAGNQHTDGKNANLAWSRFVTALEDLKLQFPEMSVLLGETEGGTAMNVVPKDATTSVEFNVQDKSRASAFLAALNEAAQAAATSIGGNAELKDPRDASRLPSESSSRAETELRFAEEATGEPNLKLLRRRAEQIASEFGCNLEVVSEVLHKPANLTPLSRLMGSVYEASHHSLEMNCAMVPRTGGASDLNTIVAIGVPAIDGLGAYGPVAHQPGREKVSLSSMTDKTRAFAAYLLTMRRLWDLAGTRV